MCKKILLVEDEKELSKAVSTILRLNNYDVTTCYNGKEALDETRKTNFDCIVMDVMMPVMDGIESLKEMRKTGIEVPIILLTARAQVEDKVEGLDNGANDYLTKPFATKELLARIRALTRVNDKKNEQIKVGNLIYDKEKNKICNESASLILSDKESKIMDILVNNQDKRILNTEIYNRIGFNDSENSKNKKETAVNINMYMNFLNEKFKALNGNVQIEEKKDKYKLIINT